MEHSDETNIYKALSAGVRRSLLDLIETNGPIDLKTLTGESQMKETTLRHHLMVLERAGLIVSEEGREGVPGRPPLVYKVPQKHWDIGFPKRQYAMLADKLLGRMIELQGTDETKSFMEQLGRESAQQVLADLLAKKGSQRLEIADIKELLVPILDKLGSAVTVSEATEDLIRVRMNNCIYFELAVKFEEIVCRGHEAFFETVAAALGEEFKVSTEACLACGDNFCVSTITRGDAGSQPE